MPKAEGPETSFPHWVTWLSLGGALLLFFGNTVPAMRERQGLQAAERELLDRRREYDQALTAAQLALPGQPARAAVDLQALLVAIDRLGWTPEELLRHYPEPAPRPDAPAADAEADGAPDASAAGRR